MDAGHKKIKDLRIAKISKKIAAMTDEEKILVLKMLKESSSGELFELLDVLHKKIRD